MREKALDLTKKFPRSPREKLGNFFHLSRMMDKARSKAANKLGEYIYPCPMDQSLLDFLNISGEVFYEGVIIRNDQEALEWLQQNAEPHTPEEIQKWNQSLLDRKPNNKESIEYFIDTRNKIAPDRTDVETWVDLIDLEEKRLEK